MRDKDIGHVDVDVEFRGQTALAFRVFDGDREVWIPKSELIDFDFDEFIAPGKAMTITIPEWLAVKKELI